MEYATGFVVQMHTLIIKEFVFVFLAIKETFKIFAFQLVHAEMIKYLQMAGVNADLDLNRHLMGHV